MTRLCSLHIISACSAPPLSSTDNMRTNTISTITHAWRNNIKRLANARAFTHIAATTNNKNSSVRTTRLLIGTAIGLASSSLYFSYSSSSSAHASPSSSSSSFDLTTDPVFNPPAPSPSSWHSNWDGLSSVPCEIDPSTGRPIHVTRHLLFIRHGQYVLPTKETREIDPVLTELGREQARLTGLRLKELGYPISVIHCSTMSRAYETALLIGESFPSVPLLRSDLLREGVPCLHSPPHPTWKPSEQECKEEPTRIKQGFEQIVKRWRGRMGNENSKQEERQIHSEEEWKKMRAEEEAEASSTRRVEKEKNQDSNVVVSAPSSPASSSRGTISLSPSSPSSSSHLSPLRVDRYELVVCHGNVIRYSLLRALQLPVQAWLRIAIFNTGISHLYITNDGHVVLRSLGEVGHLSKEQITYH